MAWTITIGVTVVAGEVLQILDELNGSEKCVIRIGNTSANRTLVNTDNDLEIKWDSTVIWEGKVYAPLYKLDETIEVTAYRETYKELEESTITADYSAGEQADTILTAIAAAAGVTAGSCPSTSVKVEFVEANTMDAVIVLAEMLNLDFYRSSSTTINIAAKGSAKGAKTNFIVPKTERGRDRAKIRNYVIVRGLDADGLVIVGRAYWDYGGSVIVKGSAPGGGYDERIYSFFDRRPKDTAGLDNVAAEKLEELLKESSGSKINIPITDGYNLYSGDTIAVTRADLVLDDTYTIFKLVKESSQVEVHLDRETPDLEKQILEARKYEDLGIYLYVPNVADIILDTPDAPTGFDATDISTSTYVAEDGTVRSEFVVSIPRVTDAAKYGLRWRKDGDSDWFTAYVGQPTAGDATYQILEVEPNVTYQFQVCSVGRLGDESSWVEVTPIEKTSAADTTAPATPTNLSATSLVHAILLLWDANSEADIDHYVVYKHTADVPGSASVIARPRTNYLIVNATQGEYDVTLYFWVKAVDRSGNASDYSTGDSAAPRHIEALELRPAIQPYNSNLVFLPKVADTHDSAQWAAGQIDFADGTNLSINSGSADNLANGYHYVYFTEGSATLSNTTNYASTIGNNVGLLAILKVSTDADQEMFIQPFYSKGLNVIADVVAAQSIIAEHVKTGTLTADKLSFTAFDIGSHTLDDVPEGSTYQRVKSVAIDVDGMVLLDQTIDGTYQRVLATAVSAGGLIILDEVVEGTYGLTLATHLDAGKLRLTSAATKDGEWYDDSGVLIEAGAGIQIYGSGAFTTRPSKDGAIQCSVDVNGAITAGAGAVVLDSGGIDIRGQVLEFKTSGGVSKGFVYGISNFTMLGATNVDIDIISSGSGGILLSASGGYIYLNPNDTVQITAGDSLHVDHIDETATGHGVDIETVHIENGEVDGIDLGNLSANLESLTDAEVTQLLAIGATTISAAQWGYLGVLNQNLRTSDEPSFDGVTAGDILLGYATGSGNKIGCSSGTIYIDEDIDLLASGIYNFTVIRPAGLSGTTNLGSTTYYFGTVYYKALSDQGCLFWADDGITLPDGTVVSDLEALKYLKKGPWPSTSGKPMIDFRDMPSILQNIAVHPDTGESLPFDPDNDEFRYYIKDGKKVHARDGVYTDRLISIMLGAIKELDAKNKKLDKKIEELKTLIS